MPTDPLLYHRTPGIIIRLSTSGNFDFELGEKEWSLSAAEGTVKVNEWLGEVEGLNRERRWTYRGSKDAGDGYLPQIGLNSDGKQEWAVSEREMKALCWMSQSRFGSEPSDGFVEPQAGWKTIDTISIEDATAESCGGGKWWEIRAGSD